LTVAKNVFLLFEISMAVSRQIKGGNLDLVTIAMYYSGNEALKRRLNLWLK